MPIRNLLLLSIFIPCFAIAQQNQDTKATYPRQSVKDARANFERMLENDFKEINEKNSQVEEDQRRSWKQIERFKHFWRPRLQGEGYLPNTIDLFNKYTIPVTKQGDIKNSSADTPWERIGPFNPVSETRGVGRINVVRQHPTRANEYWIGTAGGGVWKSSNGGQNWQPVPNTDFLTLGVSDIAISESNPDIIYIATGDDNGSGSGQFVKYTLGLMKSTDGGLTWQPTYIHYEQGEMHLVSTILIDPRDENTVLVSTDHGIFKTTDGAETFEQVLLSGNFRDMEFIEGLPDRIVATTFNRGQGGGISFHTSEDNGDTWTTRQSISGAVRAELGTSKGAPNRMWAIVAQQGSNRYHSTWYSEDYGINWIELEEYDSDRDNNYLGWGRGNDDRGQGWYDLAIDVDPVTTNKIVIGGINLWTSQNSGANFSMTSHYNGGWEMPQIHADVHDILYLRDGTSYLVAHDGGLSKYSEITDDFKNLSYGLPITQFYKLGVSQSTSNLVSGGTQDNGTFLLDGNDWKRIGGADGMETAIDPFDSDIRYRSIYYGQIDKTTNAGQNWRRIFSVSIAENDYGVQEDGPWVTPFVLDPTNPNIIYLAMTEVWKSEERGDKGTWEKISDFNAGEFNDLAVSQSDGRYVYAARSGALFLTINDGETWDRVYSNSQEIMDIAVDPNNPERVGLALSGFNAKNKVILIENGVSMNITGNLPNVSANALVLDPDDPKRMYVGTDIGVFTTYDNTGVWIKYGSGMLNTVVSEMEIHVTDRVLYAATYGTGMWKAPLIEDCTPQQNISVNINDKVEICPGDSIFINIDYPTTLLWTDGFKGNQRHIKDEGVYAVIADGGLCADYSKPFELVHFETRPNKIAAFDRTICGIDSVPLTASSGFDEYNWSNGATGRKIFVTEPGDYYVEAPNSNGCISRSDTVTINKFEIPEKPQIDVIEINDTMAVITSDIKGSRYLWKRDGIQISNSEIDVLEVKITGLYTVEVFNEGGCSNLSDETSITIVSVIWDDDYIEMTSYPNPTTEEIHLGNIATPGNYSYSIYDYAGRLVSRGMTSVSDSEAVIGVQPLMAGAYYVLLNTEGKDLRYSFVKVD